jgi:undecaprenyl-diphosphatase
MSIIEALVLGLVQGLTEFIPVSSSGHLLITHEIFGSSENTLSFDVALHVGTLLALLIYFRKELIGLAKNVFSKNTEGRLARLLIVATIPAVIVGLLFSGYIDDNLRTPTVVAVALIVAGIIMLFADKVSKNNKDNKEVTTKQGLIVGVVQSFALIPGVSRSGATMTAGLFAGLGRVQAARFSFLLAVPIIAGSAFGILLKDGGDGSTGGIQLAVGMIAAFMSGMFAIKFMLGVIGKVGLKPFAYYRFAVAVLVLIFLR